MTTKNVKNNVFHFPPHHHLAVTNQTVQPSVLVLAVKEHLFVLVATWGFWGYLEVLNYKLNQNIKKTNKI